jgi:branched-chain amino acid aminotransferase
LELLREAARLGKQKDFLARICVSRGPGSFTVNPYDTGGSEYYLITLKLKTPSPEDYEKGVSAVTAPFPAKTELAGVKSCDYLHNVLVKKHARDNNADYAVSFDSEGFLTEGPTENIVVLTKDGDLLAPSWNRILKGVTLTRVLAKAEELVKNGMIRFAGNRDIPREGLFENISEAFLTATTFDLQSVVCWDGHEISGGKPGPVARELRRLLQEEIRSENPHTTLLF